jgi:hypothetical protein
MEEKEGQGTATPAFLKRNGCLMPEQTNDGTRYKTYKDNADPISLAYAFLDV